MRDVEVDTNGNLAGDLNCLSCAYNLRGLHVDSACPECGVAVGRSLRGDLLQYSDPQWVETIAEAMRIAQIALWIGFICFVPFAFIWHDLYTSGDWGWMLAAALVGIPAMIGLLACWMFSMKERGMPAEEKPPNWRLVARWSAVLLVALLVIEAQMELAGIELWREVIACGIAVATVGVFAAGRYASALARRLPDEKLSKQTTFVALGCTLVGASSALGMTLLAIDPMIANITMLPAPGAGPIAANPGWLDAVLIFGTLGTVLAFGIFGLATVALMFRYDRALRAASKRARETWAKESAEQEKVSHP